jgi:sugar/nucleoside kinase (ribokinase family)
LSAPGFFVKDYRCDRPTRIFRGEELNTEKLPQRAARALRAQSSTLGSQRITIGLDGFVDQIISVVDKRESAEKFTRVPTLGNFGARISAAANKSTNVELVVERVKLGGNGPIMANALAAFGTQVTYIGNLGYPNLHPVFAEFAKRATVHTIAEPGYTDALEFDDGKIMMGKHASLREVNWENLLERVGRDKLERSFAAANLIGLQNWTMLPYMSDIWEHVLAEICPKMPAQPRPTFFFDLADPEKRDANDIRAAIELIGRFQKFFDVYLGLNEKESFEIGEVLGYNGTHEGEDAVQAVAKFIHDNIRTSGVVVHPRTYAVAASADGVVKVSGPFVERPLISTGAGDHFNAGFCLGKLIGADNEVSLQFGVGTSGYYVRTAKSPNASELADFLQSL